MFGKSNIDEYEKPEMLSARRLMGPGSSRYRIRLAPAWPNLSPDLVGPPFGMRRHEIQGQGIKIKEKLQAASCKLDSLSQI